MKIGDVLAKVAKGEELSEEEKTFLAEYKEPDVEQLANARAKSERRKQEKELAELKEQLEAAQEQLEHAKTGGSEVEKLQKSVEKLNAKLEEQSSQLATERESHAATRRSNALKSVQVPWLDSVSPRYRETVIAEAFDGVDTEDLGDESVVKGVVEKIVASNADFIKSPTRGGAGTGADKKKAAGEVKIPKPGDFKGKTPEEARKEVSEMWAQPAEPD